VNPALLSSALIEDLNQLACSAAQDRLSGGAERIREALNRLRFLDTTELDRFVREGWLRRGEADRLENLVGFVSQRLAPVPADCDPIAFTHGDPSWRTARERALELLLALDAFVEIGVPGWGRKYQAAESERGG